jgi:hypothetical protein
MIAHSSDYINIVAIRPTEIGTNLRNSASP